MNSLHIFSASSEHHPLFNGQTIQVVDLAPRSTQMWVKPHGQSSELVIHWDRWRFCTVPRDPTATGRATAGCDSFSLGTVAKGCDSSPSENSSFGWRVSLASFDGWVKWSSRILFGGHPQLSSQFLMVRSALVAD